MLFKKVLLDRWQDSSGKQFTYSIWTAEPSSAEFYSKVLSLIFNIGSSFVSWDMYIPAPYLFDKFWVNLLSDIVIFVFTFRHIPPPYLKTLLLIKWLFYTVTFWICIKYNPDPWFAVPVSKVLLSNLRSKVYAENIAPPSFPVQLKKLLFYTSPYYPYTIYKAYTNYNNIIIII